MPSIEAWHTLAPGGAINKSGELAPPDGEWLQHDGRVLAGFSGLHACSHAANTFWHGPKKKGVTLCRVELSGTISRDVLGQDVIAASARRILWRLDPDATASVLRTHLRWLATNAFEIWDAPPEVIEYLTSPAPERRLPTIRLIRRALVELKGDTLLNTEAKEALRQELVFALHSMNMENPGYGVALSTRLRSKSRRALREERFDALVTVWGTP